MKIIKKIVGPISTFSFTPVTEQLQYIFQNRIDLVTAMWEYSNQHKTQQKGKEVMRTYMISDIQLQWRTYGLLHGGHSKQRKIGGI